MYEKYEINKVLGNLTREMAWLWELLLKNYEEVVLLNHKDCEHTIVEIKSIIINTIINDLVNTTYFFGINSSAQIFKIISNFDFDFVRGFSMMPELNPADFVIGKTIMDIDEVKEGDIVGGYDRETGMGAIHKVTYIWKTGVFTKGNSNNSSECMTKETINNKIILRIERETEMWEYLIKNPDLKHFCIESINITLAEKQPEDKIEVEYLTNLKKRLEDKNAKS